MGGNAVDTVEVCGRMRSSKEWEVPRGVVHTAPSTSNLPQRILGSERYADHDI